MAKFTSRQEVHWSLQPGAACVATMRQRSAQVTDHSTDYALPSFTYIRLGIKTAFSCLMTRLS